VVCRYRFGVHDVLTASFGFMMSLVIFRLRSRARSDGDKVLC
jgi:hypothetical protein